MAQVPRQSERGQATLEWTGVLAVVVVVLVAAGTVAGGSGIVNAVGGAFRRALCLAGGGTCRPAQPKACVLSSSDASVRATVKLTFVKLGGRVGLLRQARSDGTFRLTLIDQVEGGLTAGAGARAEVQLGGLLHASAGGMSEAELLARLGRRRTWEVSTERAADELERRIVRSVAERMVARPVLEVATRVTGSRPVELPEPDASSLGGELELAASVGAGLGADARAGLRARLGASRDRDGSTSVTFAVDGDGALDLRRALLGLHAGGRGSVALTVSFDPGGGATRLEVAALAEGGARALLPDGAPRGERRDRVEVTGTLDLTAPDDARAAGRLLAALAPGRDGELPGAASALAARIAAAGTLSAEVRRASREAYGADLRLGLGPQAGWLVEAARVSSRLRDAWWRPPGGAWDRRLDCVGDPA